MTTATINCKYGSVTTPEVKLKTSSVNIKNLKDKNEEGSYKYPLYIKAFELFASSEAGKKYILRRSKSGFKYTGVFVDFEIKAAADGDFYNKGIDVTFQIGEMSNDYNDAETFHFAKDGRLKIVYIFAKISKKSFSTPSELLSKVNAFSHEVFYHGMYTESKYLNASQIMKNNNVRLPFRTDEDTYHTKNWENTFHCTYGLAVLIHARDIIWNFDGKSNFFKMNLGINPISGVDQQKLYEDKLAYELKNKPTKNDLLPYLFYGLPNYQWRIKSMKVSK